MPASNAGHIAGPLAKALDDTAAPAMET